MAAPRKSHRYLGGTTNITAAFGDQFEFDESEIWNTKDNLDPPEVKKPVFRPCPVRKSVQRSGNADRLPGCPKSLPVNIPDWSKIRRGEYENEWEMDDGNDKLAPHEYLARTRVASLSVHEGVGRTLKGRDLSRVRNDIWKQTGFELD